MALGALSVVNSSSLGGGGGGGLKTMNPMDSMVSTFKDIRDGIDNLTDATKGGFSGLNKHLAYRFETIVAAISMSPQPTAAEAIAGADTDAGDKKEDEEPKKGMIDSLRDKMGEGGFDKLKKALFLGVVASLILFSDQIKAVLVPLLKAGKFIFELLGPKGSLVAGLGLLAFLKFGKPLVLAIKVAKFAMIGLKAGLGLLGGALSSLAAGLMTVATSIFTFITATLVPFVIAFAIPIAIIAAVIVGVIAVIHSIKKGIEAFKTSLEEGDSMFTAIVKGVGTALLTLVTLPITLIKNFVAWVAGKLGFKGIAEKLKDFSIVDFLMNGIKSLVTKAKDFVLGLFDIDFAGMFGKALSIGKMIIGRIKAIGAAGFAAVKAAFPGGESPMEAFKRVYAERTAGGDGGGDSEPEDKGGITMSVDDAQSRMYKLQDQALMAGPDGTNQPEVSKEAEARALQTQKLLDKAYAEGSDTITLPSGSIGKQQSDAEKLTDATAEKTHEEGSKRSKTKRDEYDGLVSQGFTKGDARKILMFDTNKTKGFPAYEEASMKALGYNFTPEHMTPTEKLAWMKSKMIVDDEGNFFKPTSKGGDYKQLSQSEQRMRAAGAEGRKDLKEATAENKKAKDDAAGSGKTGNVVVNNNNNSSSNNNTTQVTPLNIDHSDPTANALKQLTGVF